MQRISMILSRKLLISLWKVQYCRWCPWGCKWSALMLWDHVNFQVLHRWLISWIQWTIFSLIVAQEDLRDRFAYKVLHETRTYPWKQNGALVWSPSITGDPKSWNGGMVEWRKMTPNPKTWNGEKWPQILKQGTDVRACCTNFVQRHQALGSFIPTVITVKSN